MGREQLSAFAALHRHLLTATDLDEIELEPFLRTVCGALDLACLSPRGISLPIDCERVALSSRVCQLVAMILTELVVNAAKHAFDAPGGGVLVRVACRPSGDIDLDVADNGQGFDGGDHIIAARSTLLSRLEKTGVLKVRVRSTSSGSSIGVQFAATDPALEQ